MTSTTPWIDFGAPITDDDEPAGPHRDQPASRADFFHIVSFGVTKSF